MVRRSLPKQQKSQCRWRETYPSSKCLQRLSGSCFFVLQDEHSCPTRYLATPPPHPSLRQRDYLTSRRTIFLVVFAFLWKTGFV